jgi:hypothetical protein
MQRKTSLLEWWWIISERRCEGCTHSKEYDYNEALKDIITIKGMSKTLGDEAPKVMWSCLSKLVHQLPGVVTFAYDLHFRRRISRWKGIIEEIHFGGSIRSFSYH